MSGEKAAKDELGHVEDDLHALGSADDLAEAAASFDARKVDVREWRVVRDAQGESTVSIGIPARQFRVVAAFAARLQMEPEMLVCIWLDERMRREYGHRFAILNLGQRIADLKTERNATVARINEEIRQIYTQMAAMRKAPAAVRVDMGPMPIPKRVPRRYQRGAGARVHFAIPEVGDISIVELVRVVEGELTAAGRARTESHVDRLIRQGLVVRTSRGRCARIGTVQVSE